MGPPVIHGTPVVPKMGVRVRMYDRSHRREVLNAQPPQMSDSLMPSVLSSESLDVQPGPETRVPLCDLWSPSTRRASVRMKRSNSEQMMSNPGGEAPENPNTGSSLRREYGSTSTLDRQTFTATKTPSSSLQAAAQIAQGNVNFILRHGNLSDSENIQNVKVERSDEARFSSNKCFSHYDVQSVLFNIRDSSSTRADLDAGLNPAAVVDDKDCSFYCYETGEETERTLDQTCSTNATVSVLEFCRRTQVFPQNEMKNYDFEHIDLGAKYYMQFFFNRGKSGTSSTFFQGF